MGSATIRMRQAGSKTALRPTAEPNIIPFIDVLLVLLVIFMVTAPKPTVDHRVDMPQSGPTVPIEGVRATVVTLRDIGGALEVAVDGEITTLDALSQTTLARAQANNPAIDFENLYAEARIYLRADQSTAYGNVVAVMDSLQTEGFARVGIFAESAEE